MKDTALVIFPYTRWELVTAQLYYTDLLGSMVELTSVVTNSKQDDELSSFLILVQKVQPMALYDLVDKQKFRSSAIFWEKADKTVQQYIKRTCDKRLAKVIRKAAELNIPIYYREAKNNIIHTGQRLSLSAEVPLPYMSFKRTDDGIEYTFALKVADEIITPHMHHANVIAAEPGIITLDNNIYYLDGTFSGKLLMPFRQKETIHIPKRTEHEYFHKFILRNVARAEVDAEGFELTDMHTLPHCRLSRVTDVMGCNSLTIEYIYGSKSFRPSDTQISHVTLEDTDDGFRFLRILRDREWEQSCRECLEECCPVLPSKDNVGYHLYNDVIRFDSLTVMINWMRCHAPLLHEKGFEMEQPSDETYYIGAMDLRENIKQSGDWLLLSSEIALEDGRTVPFLALRDIILAGKNEYTMTDGTRLIIPEAWLKRYTPLVISGTEEKSSLRVHRTLFSEQASNDMTTNQDNDDNADSQSLVKEIQHEYHVPSSLHAMLRPYQEAGFQWLANNMAHKHGCCLSDDMGLGKTVQTIALLLHYKETTHREAPKPFGMLFTEEEMRGGVLSSNKSDGNLQYVSLIVAPTSIVHNWQKELEQFAPSLSAMVYTGSPDERRKKRHALSTWDIVITTYRTLVNDIRQLSPLQYGIVVFDESQAFKNHDSQIHMAVSLLRTQHRVALSGTPVENNISELWSLFHIIQPSLLETYSAFSSHYLSAVSPLIEDIRTETLQRIVAPFMLKRRKEDVLTDLPERQDELVLCHMPPEQEQIYVSELSQARNSVMDDKPHQSIHILAAIQRLRQVACHPGLVIDNAKGCVSCKTEEVFMRLESLRGTSHKVLLFSEYLGFLRIISEEMTQRDWKHAMLTGETQHRERVISDFQNDNDCQFFLISLKAGGTGINLTQADYVFILDPWWNIAAEEQAISRAHRIGQHNAVFVYRFITEGTLEEQVLALQNDKQAIIDKVLFNAD